MIFRCAYIRGVAGPCCGRWSDYGVSNGMVINNWYGTVGLLYFVFVGMK